MTRWRGIGDHEERRGPESAPLLVMAMLWPWVLVVDQLQLAEPSAPGATLPSVRKLLPQPQALVALGLLTLKPPPIMFSTKSTSEPRRSGQLIRSTTSVMPRRLKSYARRYGLTVDDAVDGKEIPALVEAGDWDAVRSHIESDVRLTVELAQRLGVMRVAAVA